MSFEDYRTIALCEWGFYGLSSANAVIKIIFGNLRVRILRQFLGEGSVQGYMRSLKVSLFSLILVLSTLSENLFLWQICTRE